ncbi:hypothetical protein HKD37_19G053859 [Glycine soja]
MAQFTTQGRLKLLLNGEGVSSVLEHKDPFLYKCRSVQTHKRRTRYAGSSARIYYASTSSLSSKSHRCNAEARHTSGNGSVHDEYDDIDDDDDEDEDDDEEEEEDVFDRDGLSCFRGLVLDIAYRPVNVVGWKRAICLEFMEKADVLEYYAKTVNSPSGSFYIPAVLRVPHLLQVVKRRIIKNNLSRKNILFRDNYTCQYCSSHENLTIDHVVPAALGGEWTWENLSFKLVSDWLTGLIPSLLRIQSLPRLNLSPTFIVPRTWPYLLFLLGIYGQPLKSHHQNSSLLFSLFQKVLWKHCSQYCLFILFKGCFPETVFLRLFSDNVCFDLDSGLFAFDHIASNPSVFSNFSSTKSPHFITLGDGSKAKAIGIDQAVPLLSLTLDSVPFIFRIGEVEIVTGIGFESQGLYYLSSFIIYHRKKILSPSWHSWGEEVTACAKCNCKKGRKTLEEAKMKLIKPPKVPKDYDILAIPLTAAALRMLTIRKGTPEEWRQYLRSP